MKRKLASHTIYLIFPASDIPDDVQPVLQVSPPSQDTNDHTSLIQDAIDSVQQWPLQANGFRGTVQLSPGIYNVTSRLRVSESGIVVRGLGHLQEAEDAGNYILVTGQDEMYLPLFSVRGGYADPEWTLDEDRAQPLVSSFVPVGAKTIELPNACAFHIGQDVVIRRNASIEWIRDLKMDEIDNPWPIENMDYARVVTRIDEDHCRFLTLNAPLVTAMDARYGVGLVIPILEWRETIENVGIERILAISIYSDVDDLYHAGAMVEPHHVRHSWFRELTAVHFSRAIVDMTRYESAGHTNSHLSIIDCNFLDPIGKLQWGWTHLGLKIRGHLHLVLGCYSRGSAFDFVTASGTHGPHVFAYCTAENGFEAVRPH